MSGAFGFTKNANDHEREGARTSGVTDLSWPFTAGRVSPPANNDGAF